MVLTKFCWPYGGRHVFICGSFTRWAGRYAMVLTEGSLTEFQAFLDLPPGIHQYRFMVDGIWRYDQQCPRVTDEQGIVNNVLHVEEPNALMSVLQHEHSLPTTMDMDNPMAVSSTSVFRHMTPKLMLSTAEEGIEIARNWISDILSKGTIYDILPASSKVHVMDVHLPVKEAFHIMHEEGLAVVPLWDESTVNITGMLTASDFILILAEIQANVQVLSTEEFEMHTVSAWKKGKVGRYEEADRPPGAQQKHLIYVRDDDCLKDVALKIIRNKISAIPIFSSSSQTEISVPLINTASLPGILKFVCMLIGDRIGSIPLLQCPIYSIPLGSWLRNTGTNGGCQLTIVRNFSSLSSLLNLLLEARVSSVPVVDENGSLMDVYSRSDIMSLSKDDMYARIQPDHFSIQQALDQIYHVNGLRQCPTCFRSSTLFEVMVKLSDPVVRRLVVIDATTRQVEGIISLRDVFSFLLG